MCGRYTLINKNRILEVIQNFTLKVNLAAEIARWNIAPSQDVLIVTNRERPTLEKARWGLVPSWAKDPSIGDKMINARSETLAEKPAFRTALAKRRCLIFADGFYEWRKEADGKTRTPMYIHRKDEDLLAFAGLWEMWTPPGGAGGAGGETVESCTIITTAANELVRPIHDRMPAIVPREAYPKWLDPVVREAGEMAGMLGPYPAEEMEAYAVSRAVNSPRAEGAALVRRVDESVENVASSKAKREGPRSNQGRLF